MAKISDLLAGGPTVSFEFFPPKTDAAALTLGRTIAELEPLHPSFVSVTYGAGGSTRHRTRDIVVWIARETDITPMAHLTCVGHTRAEITEILENYREAGIENILALYGDPPADAGPDYDHGDFRYAVELVEFIKEFGGFSVGVAAHPELHPRSPDRATDRRFLAEKLAVADFGVTQFFFEADHYFRMVEEVAEHGVTTPIIPGIMPVNSVKAIKRMAELSGAHFPDWLAERLTAAADPAAVRQVGIEVATEMCRELLEGGVPGLHLYTLNRSNATREIYAALGTAVGS
ncbi:MAG TPA: methylenetetrahydrofolate reductase [NAD(P)H] [Acidimicrobiales bacterium]|nr:methylenetetrahydrofolate reductase [NAD(P)H] [Acidimicrobiales bacterium]